MYFPPVYRVTTLIGQGVPQLKGVRQGWGGENKLLSSKMRQSRKR